MADESSSPKRRIAVIGGGAAGFFAAVTAAEADPAAQVMVYERGRKFLQKVKISGGGRCNVTHACFDPRRLATHYPRGGRELRGAFFRWQPRDTVDWFRSRGVLLKTEADGRMFPLSDDSQTIIDCLMTAAREAGVRLRPGCGVAAFRPDPGGGWGLKLADGAMDRADAVLVAAGSLKGSPLAGALEAVGHTIEPLAPSLFALNVSDSRIQGLAGLSAPDARVWSAAGGAGQGGPLLITHRGLSGPAVLKLSAWEARAFQAAGYRFSIRVSWLGDREAPAVRAAFGDWRRNAGRTLVKNRSFDAVPRRLWERLVEAAGIPANRTWAQLSKPEEAALTRELLAGEFAVDGKTTNKEEFVTCGGVRLSEVDFRTMESKRAPGLFLAGESLDLDGVTGGFNFQAAWTTGRLAGLGMT